MEKKWTLTGLALLIVSIVLGAFGAHGLKDVLNEQVIGLDPGARYQEVQEQLNSFETGVRYMMIHAVLFLIVPFILVKFNLSGTSVFWFLLLGVILFSGSIFGLTACNLSGIEGVKKAIGPVTPIGGLLMIVGWVVLFVQVLRSRNV